MSVTRRLFVSLTAAFAGMVPFLPSSLQAKVDSRVPLIDEEAEELSQAFEEAKPKIVGAPIASLVRVNPNVHFSRNYGHTPEFRNTFYDSITPRALPENIIKGWKLTKEGLLIAKVGTQVTDHNLARAARRFSVMGAQDPKRMFKTAAFQDLNAPWSFTVYGAAEKACPTILLDGEFYWAVPSDGLPTLRDALQKIPSGIARDRARQMTSQKRQATCEHDFRKSTRLFSIPDEVICYKCGLRVSETNLPERKKL